MKNPILGILGGLGPASSVYFYDLITSHTKAGCDSDHIDLVLSSHATTPDRTDYIVGRSRENPVTCMAQDARKLEAFGADFIAIPCNTAHTFYEELAEAVSVPVINIMAETVGFLHFLGVRKVGVLATDGTVQSGAYSQMCSRFGIECVFPSPDSQRAVMALIYQDIKGGRLPAMERFEQVCGELFAHGCERIILGCTELSLIKKQARLDDRFVDALEVLACRCIALCKKEPVDFSQELIDFEVHNHAAFPVAAKSRR